MFGRFIRIFFSRIKKVDFGMNSDVQNTLIEDQDWEDYWDDVKQSPIEQWISHYKARRGYKKFADKVLEYLQIGPVLEIGSGLAYVSRSLAEETKKKIFALDYNLNVCKQASHIVEKEGKDIKFIRGDIHHLPFSDKSIEVVMSTGLLEHFEEDDLLSIINEMKRVSRIVIANLPQRHYSWQPLWKTRRFLGSRLDPDQRLYSENEMEQLFRRIGFKNIDIQTMYFSGLFPYTSLVAR